MTRSRGFALIIVLWAVVSIGLGAAILTSTGRRTIDEADAVGRQARAAAAIDSAVAQALFHLLTTGESRWAASGTHVVRTGGSTVEVAIVNQAGFVNPNTAAPPLLAALLVALGQPRSDATALATAIVEWRSPAQPNQDPAQRYRDAGLTYAPPNAPFQTLGELRLVLGMTPALFGRLEPLLTLWHDGEPDPALAAGPVRDALRSLGVGASPPVGIDLGTGAVALICRIRTGPARAVRRVVVRLQPGASPPFLVLRSDSLSDS